MASKVDKKVIVMIGYPIDETEAEYDFAKEISDNKTTYIPFDFTNKDLFFSKQNTPIPGFIKDIEIKEQVLKECENKFRYSKNPKIQFFFTGHGNDNSLYISNDENDQQINTADFSNLIADITKELKSKYPNIKIELKSGCCEWAGKGGKIDKNITSKEIISERNVIEQSTKQFSNQNNIEKLANKIIKTEAM